MLLHGPAASAEIIRLGAQLDQRLLKAVKSNAFIEKMDGWLVDGGTVNGTLADTSNGAIVDVDEAMIDLDEDEEMVATDPTQTAFSLSVGRIGLARDTSDLFIGTGSPDSLLDPVQLAANMPNNYAYGVNRLFFATFASLTETDVGATGQPVTVDTIFDAQFALQDNDNALPFFCGLSPRGIGQLQDSLRGEVGAIAWNPATAEMMAAKGPGSAGEWNGIQFASFADVTTVGADRLGAMWTQGAFARKTMVLDPKRHFFGSDGLVVVAQGNLVVLIKRKSSYGVRVEGQGYVGVGIVDQRKAIPITHSAT